MELWTIQNAGVLDVVRRDGIYHVMPSMIEFPDETYEAHDIETGEKKLFDDHAHGAYLWLVKQMRQRVSEPPDGVIYPIWAWFKAPGRQDGKEDMRGMAHVRRGIDAQDLVRLKLDIPEERVLLSDFDAWHCCLNYWMYTANESETDDFDARLEQAGFDIFELGDTRNFHEPGIETFREELVDSWDNIFDLSFGDEDWIGKRDERSIQATFWELREDDIVKAELFPRIEEKPRN